MIDLLLESIVSWVILLTALVSYQLVLQDWLQLSRPHAQLTNQWQQLSNVLIASMPLCGLLGTIIGLLSVFAGLAHGDAGASQLSDGIGQALFTTQLGLTCAIPAWLLQTAVNNKRARVQLASYSVQGA